MVADRGGNDRVSERDHEISLLPSQVLNMPMLPHGANVDIRRAKKRRLVYICDWLPPDFGAVGQYAMLFAREWAKNGWAVTLVGLTTGEPRRDIPESVGEGTLEVIRVRRPTYEKSRFTQRLLWTLV